LKHRATSNERMSHHRERQELNRKRIFGQIPSATEWERGDLL
jgi:hypothetical protein